MSSFQHIPFVGAKSSGSLVQGRGGRELVGSSKARPAQAMSDDNDASVHSAVKVKSTWR